MTAIAYTRTSTSSQTISHLAQLKAITNFAANEGMTLVGSYCDTASGCDDEREGLRKAIAQAKRIKAPILILRIDRLGRKLSSLFKMLEDSNVRFVFTENGMNVDRFTLNILACVAANERALISKRTKEALARLKEQGVQLGNLESLNKHRAKGTATMKARGQANVSKYSPIVKAILADRPLSVRKVAKRLEDMGVKTPQGKTKWSYAMTQKIMAS